MDRLTKLLVFPAGITACAVFGIGLMTNVLQPFWPNAPHWVFAALFLSGAALTFAPLPAWLLWLGWKNRKSFGRRVRMVFGFSLLLLGCALGVIGLSLIASGPGIEKDRDPPAVPAPVQNTASASDNSVSNRVPEGMVSLEGAIETARFRLGDLPRFSIGDDLWTREGKLDQRLLFWSNHLSRYLQMYRQDGSVIDHTMLSAKDGKVTAGDAGPLYVKKHELEAALARARADFPPIPPGFHGIRADDSPRTAIINNKGGPVEIHKSPDSAIVGNDVSPHSSTQAPLITKGPYPPGAVLDRPFSRDQAQTMLNALGDMVEAATKCYKLEPPSIYLPFEARKSLGYRWNAQIAHDGLDKAIEALTAFDARLEGTITALSQSIEKYPSIYAEPLVRIRGQTGLEKLQQATKAYIRGLKAIQNLTPKPENIGADFILTTLGPTAKSVTEAINDVVAWYGTFTRGRYSDALKELQEFTK